MKRALNFFLLLIIVSAQLALAQHATVHFVQDEHINYITAAKDTGLYQPAPADEHAPELAEFCQLCFVSKNYYHLTFTDAAIAEVHVIAAPIIFASVNAATDSTAYYSYRARGPPVQS